MSTPEMYDYYLDILESFYTHPPQSTVSIMLLKAFTNLALSSNDFTEHISSKCAQNQFSSTLTTFLTNLPPHPQNLSCGTSCQRYSLFQSFSIQHALCTFILKISFIKPSFIEFDILTLSLVKSNHISSFLSQLTCIQKLQKSRFPVLLEEIATPFSQNSESWRRNLENEFLRDAHSKYNSIVDTIGIICRDLERRCEIVERPLREAREQLHQVKEEMESVVEEKVALEQKNEEYVKEIMDVKKEKEMLNHEIKCLRLEIEGCQTGLREAISARDDMRNELEKEKRGLEERIIELLRTNGILDDDLKEVQRKSEVLKEDVSSLDYVTNLVYQAGERTRWFSGRTIAYKTTHYRTRNLVKRKRIKIRTIES
jgi:hypothetical protein